VRVGEDPFARDNHARALHLLRAVFGPWAQDIGGVVDCMDLDDQIPNLILSFQYRRLDGEKTEHH
jgi:hypothetical protein